MTELVRPRVLLLGDPAARPEGLERALVRGGFQVTEADSITISRPSGPLPDLILLTSAQARGDLKPLAKTLIDRFHGFAGVLAADRRALAAVPGMGDAAVAALMAVREAGLRLARTELRERPVLGSWQKVGEGNVPSIQKLAFVAVTIHGPVVRF